MPTIWLTQSFLTILHTRNISSDISTCAGFMNIEYCIYLSIAHFFFYPLEILGGLLPHICDLLRFSYIASSRLLNEPEDFVSAAQFNILHSVNVNVDQW